MAVSGVNNYRDVLFSWQGQQLKNTGNGSSSSSGSLNSLFNDSVSMTAQIASMVELTKYAMDNMGLGADSRVTFSQITKYREKLQSEFNQSVKKGFADSGISDVNALSFTLDKDGKISVLGANAQDRKKAQAWLDSNPSYGKDLRAALEKDGMEAGKTIEFHISSTGKMTLVDDVTRNIQAALDKDADLTKDLRKALEEMGYSMDSTLEFSFGDDGALMVKGDDEKSQAINKWLSENTAIADAVKKELEKKDIDTSAATLRLGKEGNIQIHVNNAENNDIQASLDKLGDTGSKIMGGLNNLAIDPNVTFSIQVDADGKIAIISDHPDRDKVQKFFEDNPELLKKYRQIETLAGIDDARKAMQISPSAMRKRIQIESMSAWWAGSGSANSYFGMYGNGNMSLLAGLNMQI